MSRRGELPLADMRALAGDFMAFGGRRLAAALALMLAGGMLEGVGLAALVPILSLLTPQVGGRWRAEIGQLLASVGLTTLLAQLAAVLAVFCAIIGLRAVTLATRDRLLSDLSLGFVDHQRLRIIEALAHARWHVLARLRHARVAYVLSSELTRLALACSMVLTILTSMVMLAVQAGLMILLSPALAIMMIGLALLGLLAIVPMARRSAVTGKATARVNFRIAGEAAHFLGGLKLAIAHDMADAFVTQIGDESGKLRAELDAQQRFQSRTAIISASVAAVVGAGMIFGAAALRVPTVTLLAALVILVRMSAPVRGIQMYAQQLFGVLPAFATLGELRAELGERERERVAGQEEVPPFDAAIRFEGVAFRYPGAAETVFDGLDLVIEPGLVVGLGGPSGAGKTTFVDLLTGLLEPSAGRILVGDTVLAPVTVAAWRRRLAYVAQDSFLLNDDVRRNLTWGGEAVPDATLWDALAQAGAAELVAAMPQGLDTAMDERGTRLSGGERQRVALARAILRRPRLLILDEATNAIDVATELAVIANVRRALPEATIIIIAHREETLRACDQVILLDQGVVSRRVAQRNTPTSAVPGSIG